MKILTLAVPTYNMEPYLEKCVRSCMCDNKHLLEVLIVNDGSTDGSSTIAHKLQSEYPEIVTVIDKENGNYGTCVNRAISEAQGKYFRMLDADDWANTEALNSLLDKLQTCDADCIVTISEDYVLGNELMQRLGPPSTVEIGKVYDAQQFDGIEMKFDDLYCSHIITYKTEILRDIHLHLQAGISYTDNEYVFYPLDKIKSIIFYDLPIYQYYLGRPGASTEDVTDPIKIQKKQHQMWQVLKGLFEYFYLHFKETPEAVRNNQRIMIAEMVRWIYPHSLKYYNDGGGDEDLIKEIQPYVMKDAILEERVRNLVNKDLRFQPINWYEHLRRTGKVKNYTPIYDWYMTYEMTKLKFEILKGKIRNLING